MTFKEYINSEEYKTTQADCEASVKAIAELLAKHNDYERAILSYLLNDSARYIILDNYTLAQIIVAQGIEDISELTDELSLKNIPEPDVDSINEAMVEYGRSVPGAERILETFQED